MKRLFWIMGIMGACWGCASTQQPAVTEVQDNLNTQETAQTKRILPPLAQGDIRIELTPNGAVVDAHCAHEHVTVTRVDKGTPELMFEADADLMGATENVVGFVDPVDINFDGYMDILIPHAVGAHNTAYRAWIWDNNRQKFEEVAAFKDLGSCTFKPELKEIHAFTHISAAEYTEAVWAFHDRTLIRKLLIWVAPENETGENFWVEITRQIDGQNVKSKHLVPEKDLSAFVKNAYTEDNNP